jgi:hypothetical protein
MGDGMQIAEAHQLRGYYPARWSHHPDEIRAALRRTRLRPGLKECHANSQRFILRAEELRDRLEYREGWVASGGSRVFEHAWLTLDGAVLDLTLDSREFRYVTSYAVPFGELARYLAGGNHGFVRPDELRGIAP